MSDDIHTPTTPTSQFFKITDYKAAFEEIDAARTVICEVLWTMKDIHNDSTKGELAFFMLNKSYTTPPGFWIKQAGQPIEDVKKEMLKEMEITNRLNRGTYEQKSSSALDGFNYF